MKKFNKKLFPLYLFILLTVTILNSCFLFDGSNYTVPTENQIIAELNRMVTEGNFTLDPDETSLISDSRYFKYIQINYIYKNNAEEIKGKARYEYVWSDYGFSSTPKFESDFYYHKFKSQINNKLTEEAKRFFKFSNPEIKVLSSELPLYVPVSEKNLTLNNFLTKYYSTYHINDAILVKKPDGMPDNEFMQNCNSAAYSFRESPYLKKHIYEFYKVDDSEFTGINSYSEVSVSSLTRLFSTNN